MVYYVSQHAVEQMMGHEPEGQTIWLWIVHVVFLCEYLYSSCISLTYTLLLTYLCTETVDKIYK